MLLAVVLLGCGSTARTRGRLDFLVDYGATKQQVIAEFGQPESTTRTPEGELCVFIPSGSSKTRTVRRVVDGKEQVESTTTSVPGKLRMSMLFRDDKLVSYTLAPNR